MCLSYFVHLCLHCEHTTVKMYDYIYLQVRLLKREWMLDTSHKIKSMAGHFKYSHVFDCKA